MADSGRLRNAPTPQAATRERQQEHGSLAPVGFLLSMAGPAAVAIAGIAVEGVGAIDWLSAAVWGVLATVVFTLFSVMGKAMGMTRMDLLDVLGSTMAEPGSGRAKRLGAIIHHVNGAILAVAWAYGTLLVDVEANWASGAVWGVILTAFALLMMSTIGSVHPAIRRGEQTDPGLLATNFGAMTPMGSLAGHVVYGVVLGLGYAHLPIG